MDRGSIISIYGPKHYYGTKCLSLFISSSFLTNSMRLVICLYLCRMWFISLSSAGIWRKKEKLQRTKRKSPYDRKSTFQNVTRCFHYLSQKFLSSPMYRLISDIILLNSQESCSPSVLLITVTGKQITTQRRQETS